MRRLTILAVGFSLGLMSCRAAVQTGRPKNYGTMPLCERVVSRMINCSTDADFKHRVRSTRKRAVQACKTEGLKAAKKCDRHVDCDRFVKCLRK